MRHANLIVAVCLLSAACGFQFERRSEVIDRRILAIRAEPPEVIVDGTLSAPAVQLTALVVDPSAPDAVAEYEWRVCARVPGLIDTIDSDTGRCREADDLPPIDAGEAPLGSLGVTVPVPAELAMLLQGAGAASLALSMTVNAQLSVQTDQGPIVGFKRLVLSTATPPGRQPNRNPRLSALLFDGEVWEADTPIRIRHGACDPAKRVEVVDRTRPGELVKVCEHKITPVFDEAEAETYPQQKFDGDVIELRELLQFDWYVDHGSVSEERTEQYSGVGPRKYDPVSTNWREPPEPRDMTVWVVVRDGRLGVSWEKRRVEFVAP